ncbi:uncharacterized protein ACN2A1_006564 isoform 1-T11 [Glossina fuscipes fuscipes]
MHSTTGNKIMTTTSQTKSPLLKTKNSPSGATISNATIVSKSDSLEIEEISKKISEHADALYRTWKNRGLVPPAEILEFYTVEAAQAAGASKEELQSTEGLQKLVNTFVIKDKEQRGKVKKTATTKTAAPTTTTATSSNTEVKTCTTTTAATIKNQLSDHVTATTSLSSNSKMPSLSSSSLVSPISQNVLTSTTSTLIFNNSKQTINSCVVNSSRIGSLQKQQQQQHLKLDDQTYSQQSKQQKQQQQQQLSQNLQQQLLYPQQLKLEQKQLKHNQQTQQQKQQQVQPSIHPQQQQQQVKHNQLLQQQKGQHMQQSLQQQLKSPQYQEHQQQKSYLQLKQPLQPLQQQQQQQQQMPIRSQLHAHEPQNQYQSEIGQKITSSKIKLNTKSSKPSTDILDSVTKSATNLNGNPKKVMMNTAPHVTKVPVSSQATAHLEKNLNFDIDLDLKLDLNLDVKQLSEMQNQNLRKIKDLLNQSNAKIPTKIPTLTINTNNSNQGRGGGAGVEHSIKMKQSAKVTNIITAPLIDDLRQRLKHDDGNDNETTTTIREMLTASEMPANKKLKEMQRIKTNDLNSKREKDLINADEKLIMNDKNAGKSNSTSISSSSSSNSNSSSSNSSTSSSSSSGSSGGSSSSSSVSISSGSSSCVNNSSNDDIINSNVNIITHTSAENTNILTSSAAPITTTTPLLLVDQVIANQAGNAFDFNKSLALTTEDIVTSTIITTAVTTTITATTATIITTPATTTTTTTPTTPIINSKSSKTGKVIKNSKATLIKDSRGPQSLIEIIAPASAPALAPAPASATTKTPTTTLAVNSSLTSPMDEQSNVNVSDISSNSSSNSSTTMPTPIKVKTTRNALSNGQEKNLRSNFLTRGSVAERVLMFEKCPDVRNAFLNIKRPDKVDTPPKVQVKLHATPPPAPVEQHSLQKEIRTLKSVYIPRFYFPHGKPQPTIALERTLRGILSAFDTFPNNQVTKDELPRILKICGLPFYWRMPVMVFCQQHNSGLVERQRFVEFWKQMNVYCHDAASRFVYILSRGQRFRNNILPEDLIPLVQDVVDTHPGLAFLKEATEFHSRYVHTVIARIFYSVNRSWSGKISIAELKKSDLLEIITLLEEEDDINQIMAFFSYEHFYVIYCKFWELDKDHDLLINQDDLSRHSDHALSSRIVERIFSGCVTRNDNRKNPDDEAKMSYTDFVWFLLSEEDKRTPTAIEYWFRCMDLDGDGVLSMYELEYFYEEQQQRMESIGIESLPFEDCLCQMLDMIKPQNRDAIALGDLKRCKMTHVFFDTFFNLEKYLDHEQRDPFATQRDEYCSDWDRFAAQEYELLITEEND